MIPLLALCSSSQLAMLRSCSENNLEYMGVCIGSCVSCVGEKEGMMHTGECVTFYLPNLPTYLFRSHVSITFRRRDLQGKRPTPPPAIFSFLFCLAPFAITKFAHKNIAMYVHTLKYIS